MSDTGSPLSSTTSMGNDGSTVHTTRDDIAVCPDCGIECPPEWGPFDYFDHLASHGG